MKKNTVSILMAAGLLSILLSGCQTGAGPLENTPDPVTNMDEGTTQEEESTEKEDSVMKHESESEADKQISALPYQFVRKYGIIKSEYPVYELDTVIESKIPQKEKAVSLTFAVCQKQELIVSIVLDDYSEVERTAAGGEPPADGMYYTLKDGTMVDAKRYRNELWVSGEGLFLTGPGLPEAGIKPQESTYAYNFSYFEVYGHRRYIIEARFEIPSASDYKNNLSGYALRLLDFEKPLEFALKRAPEYETLEALVAGEHGSMDTHDGISIISMGEKVDEGILINWYIYSETDDSPVAIAYKAPLQEDDWPTISGDGKQYPIKQLSANPYWDTAEIYRLTDVKRYGRRSRYLFDVPPGEQNAAFQANIPGITFLNSEEAPQITLPIPEDYEELSEEIPWKAGSVRILSITRMKEPQTVVIPDKDKQNGVNVTERPAVYIDVMAMHEDKDLTLTGLLCERKSQGSGWERERYDYGEAGNLSGFRILYDEGDTEVTLKFTHAAFFWNQPYVMDLPLPD